MTNEISLVKIKLLAKWMYSVTEEITNNKGLNDEDIMILLLSMKNILSDINTEIEIILRENSHNKK